MALRVPCPLADWLIGDQGIATLFHYIPVGISPECESLGITPEQENSVPSGCLFEVKPTLGHPHWWILVQTVN